MEWSDQQKEAIEKAEAWLHGNQNKQVFRLFGYAGSGKEQPVSCSVQTPDGRPTKIGSLKIGDRVFGSNGLPTTVTGIFPQGAKPVYKVTFRDGTSTRCGLDHLWMIRTQKWTKAITLRDIIDRGLFNCVGDMKFQIPLCDPVEYETRSPEYHPYLIGALIGDGYLGGNIVCICMPDTDDGKGEILDSIREILPDGFEIHTDRSPSCPRHTIVDTTICHGNRLKAHLERIGLRVKSPERFIPYEYLTSPTNDRIELLRGLMDTDGSILKNRVHFHTMSARLARDVVTLVQSLGGTAIMRSIDRGEKGLEYSVNVKTKFNPFSLTRKASQWSYSWKNPPSRYISAIEDDGIEEQVCIMVDAPNHLYLTDNFIVTHNSTLCTELVKSVKGQILYGAYTGKAALVMQSKGCYGARTIHSMIYKPTEDPVTGKLRFELYQDSPARDAKLIVIDEVSMCDLSLAQDLLSFGTPVLVMGDPGQLPPISGTGYFMSEIPDVMLTEVHRQAKGNPIIQLATTVREGGKLQYGTYGESRVIPRSALTQSDVLNADQCLVGMNKTRRNYNRKIRGLLGYEGEFPDVGDKLVCLKNNKDKGLLNGSLWTCLSREMGERTVEMVVQSIDFPGQPPVSVDVPYAFFTGTEAELDKWFRRSHDEFDYGRALTVHKFQGSQGDRIVLVDESSVFRENATRHLYTGITRAAKSITIVMG